MRLVIDIPDRIQYGIEIGITMNGSEASQIVLDAVKNGTPLPKGHGALKDEKDLITKVELNYRNSAKPIYVEEVKDMIRTTVSVIKADK